MNFFKKPFFTSRFFRIAVSILSVLAIIVAVTGVLGFFFVYLPAKDFYQQVNSLQANVSDLKTAVANKDLKSTQVQIDNLQSKIGVIEKSYTKFKYASFLPYAKNYYRDGLNAISIAKEGLSTGTILIKAIEPYQDFLGLKSAVKTDANQTTEDRIAFLTQSVESIIPHLDTINQNLNTIENNLNQIDANRYPENFKDIPLRSLINQAKQTVGEAHKLFSNGQPILKKISWLLGKDKARNYLLIFQNNGELRASGGFWTAYSTLTIKDGKISAGASNNIYDLDDKVNSKIPAPRIIKNYHINVPYFYVRDMNISPDYPTAAATFLEYYQKAYGTKTKFDAVIALDTELLVDLVEVFGTIDTPLGKFNSKPDNRCNGCPMIIYELEYMAGRPRNYIDPTRKGFLGPLMHSMLSNAMGSGKEKLGALAQVGINSIYEKHLMFYFVDPEMQSAAVLANMAGSITQTDNSTDYLALNDSNFAGAKSNLFITQKIKHEITTKDNKVSHKVGVTYTNPFEASNCNLEKGDLCLNASQYRDLFRFYVPTGSTLQKMTGSEVTVEPYQELGKTVFEGFYGNKYPLYPKSSSKISIEYTSSVPLNHNYTLLLQKQPGTKSVDYEIWLNGKKVDAFNWVADKTIKLSL